MNKTRNRTIHGWQLRLAGFTLIEVMIVVAIISIIAAFGIPSYTSYMEKTRRVEAKTILSEIAGEQQRFFTENNRFAADLTEMGYPTAAMLSENGFYSASVTANTASSYTITAAPVAGGAQESDSDCGSFTINSAGIKGVDGAALAADECW